MIVRPGEAGIAFIDPPLTWALLRRTALLRLAIPAVILTAFATAAAFAGWPKYAVGWPVVFLAVLVFFEGGRLLRRRRFPTIIEAGRDGLTVTFSPRRRVVIPAADLDDIHASRPIRAGQLLGRNSSLIVSARGRRFTALADRDYAEVLWLARQLRIATGRPVDHPIEPAPPFRGEQQSDPESSPPRSSELSDYGSRPVAGPKATKKTLGQFLPKEYGDLGCAACLFLFASLVTGVFASYWLTACLVICLQFGLNGYFRHGIHPIPNRGFELNNGQQLGDVYKALFIAIRGCALLAWMFVSLLVAIGINHLADRLQRRRWRLRAERERGDRRRRQPPQGGRGPGPR